MNFTYFLRWPSERGCIFNGISRWGEASDLNQILGEGVKTSTNGALVSTLLMSAACSAARAESAIATDMDAGTTSGLSEITVTARRIDLIGKADTASEAVVADQEILLLPAYSPGQLLETVPGLIVTLHSGEGKANQFLLRGYNLDHGTDLETYVDASSCQSTHSRSWAGVHRS